MREAVPGSSVVQGAQRHLSRGEGQGGGRGLQAPLDPGAGIICASLLASDPADRRVREFARMVQREHVAALYTELPPVAVSVPVHDPEGMALLKPEERQIAGLVNGS